VHDWLAANVDRVKDVGLAIPFALELHLIQLGRGLQMLSDVGYGEVGEATTRAMVSAFVNVLAILRDNRDRVALQYLWYSVQRRQKYLGNLIKNELLKPEQAKAYEAAAAERDAKVLLEYKGRGIEPLTLGGNRKNTWSTLSDRDLFEYADALPWHEVHYAPLSDGAHASVAAIAYELAGLSSNAIVTGPRWSDPLLLASVSIDVIGHSFVTLAEQLSSEGVQCKYDVEFEPELQEAGCWARKLDQP
jgi:hypothetical protein